MWPSRQYYPVSFHIHLTRQAVKRLEIEDTPSRFTQARRHIASGLDGWMHVFHRLKNLSGGGIDPTSVGGPRGVVVSTLVSFERGVGPNPTEAPRESLG